MTARRSLPARRHTRRAGLGAVAASLVTGLGGCGLPPVLEQDELVSRISAVDGVASPSFDAKDPNPTIRVSMDPRADAQTLGMAGREITALLADHRHRPKHPHIIAWRGPVTAELAPGEDAEDWEPARLPLEQMGSLEGQPAMLCAALAGTSAAPAATVVPELPPLDWHAMALTSAERDASHTDDATGEAGQGAGASDSTESADDPLPTPGALVVTTVRSDAFACGGGADDVADGAFASDGIPLTRAAERIVVDHGHPQALAQLTALRAAVESDGRIVEAEISSTEEGAPVHPTGVRIVVTSADGLERIEQRMEQAFGPHADVIAEAVAESGERLIP